jgi:hypothetical protein
VDQEMGLQDMNERKGSPMPSNSGKVGHFDICKAMAMENQDIRIAGLENITNLQATKQGDTKITIGFPGNVIAAIALEQKFIGGLMLIDKKQYFATRDRLQAELDSKPKEGESHAD